MDPLHPLVPIQPAPPVPPDYTRVQRVERDSSASLRRTGKVPLRRTKRSSATSSSRTTTTRTGQTKPAEAYNDHGELTEQPRYEEPAPPETEQPWNPRRQGERRAHPRHREDPAGHEDPEDPEDLVIRIPGRTSTSRPERKDLVRNGTLKLRCPVSGQFREKIAQVFRPGADEDV